MLIYWIFIIFCVFRYGKLKAQREVKAKAEEEAKKKEEEDKSIVIVLFV